MSFAGTKASRYASFEREMLMEDAQRDPDYARYEPGLTRQELFKVLNYDKKNSAQAKLPTKPGLVQEVLRWNPGTIDEKQLTKLRRHEIIGVLYRVINVGEPRRRTEAKQYRRYGLSFDYDDDLPLPTPEYRPDLKVMEIRARFELYPTLKITIADLKAILKEYSWGGKRTGTKSELLERVRNELGCSDIYECEYYTYKNVKCWQEERQALQTKFDAERQVWQTEIDSNPTCAQFIQEAKAGHSKPPQVPQDRSLMIAKARAFVASSRHPWSALPYDNLPAPNDKKRKHPSSRQVWQTELDSNPACAQSTQGVKAGHSKPPQVRQDRSAMIAEARAFVTSGLRPWSALPYDNSSANDKKRKQHTSSRGTLEAAWRAKHPKLSFAYSGSRVPQSHEFDTLLADYLTDAARHAHHMLAYLEQGFGTTGPADKTPSHRYMTHEKLKRVHGRQCTDLGTSHEYALDRIRRIVAIGTDFRYKHGL